MSIDWFKLLGEQAWLAEELASKAGINPRTMRYYLRRAYNVGVLNRREYGRYIYYIINPAYRKRSEEKQNERVSGNSRQTGC